MERGNESHGQVISGPNSAVQFGYQPSADPVHFTGGVQPSNQGLTHWELGDTDMGSVLVVGHQDGHVTHVGIYGDD